MSIFTDIADQWQIADDSFAALESAAFAADNEQDFDAASEQRKRNDQAYFLFMFTRFEQAVTAAVKSDSKQPGVRCRMARSKNMGRLVWFGHQGQ